jgi:uncharacterized protein (TIGR04255 family)
MSVVWPHYENPPVIEAVLSIAIEPLPEAALAQLKKVADDMTDVFPKVGPRYQAALSFQVGPAFASSAGQTTDGYVLRSADDTRVVELTLQSIAAHQLRPYTDWQTLEDLLRSTYESVEQELPIKPTALGVRYVNKLDIPAGAAIEDYCRTYIEISRDLPQEMNQYILRIEQQIGKAKVVTQSTFVPPDVPDTTSMILDFDYRFELEPDQSIWDITGEARNLKNMVFNNTLTQNMKERLS